MSCCNLRTAITLTGTLQFRLAHKRPEPRSAALLLLVALLSSFEPSRDDMDSWISSCSCCCWYEQSCTLLELMDSRCISPVRLQKSLEKMEDWQEAFLSAALAPSMVSDMRRMNPSSGVARILSSSASSIGFKRCVLIMSSIEFAFQIPSQGFSCRLDSGTTISFASKSQIGGSSVREKYQKSLQRLKDGSQYQQQHYSK